MLHADSSGLITDEKEREEKSSRSNCIQSLAIISSFQSILSMKVTWLTGIETLFLKFPVCLGYRIGIDEQLPGQFPDGRKPGAWRKNTAHYESDNIINDLPVD